MAVDGWKSSLPDETSEGEIEGNTLTRHQQSSRVFSSQQFQNDLGLELGALFIHTLSGGCLLILQE